MGAIKITKEQIADLPAITLAKEEASVVAAYIKMTNADRVSYLASPHRIYVYGLITYQDIFGLSQWAEFCHYLDFSKFSPFFVSAKLHANTKTDISMMVAEFGNDTSLNPQHAPQMKVFWERMGWRRG